MNRGDYGKIPCIMGDYDTGIRGPLNPREWFAASHMVDNVPLSHFLLKL